MAKQITLRLTEPQREFVLSDAPHPGMVAGYGAGKSQAAVVRIALRACQYPKLSFAFVEPTFDLVRLIAWPRFTELLTEWGVDHELNKAESILRLENDAQIIFRSADNPARLVGFEVADAVIDEIDVLRADQARDVWIKMLGRARQKKPDGAPNTVACVSTPEGFKWMYHTFQKDPRPGYVLYRAPTSSNPYLPEGYLAQLEATYSASQLQAYCEGIFTNLASGTVYPEFDRKRHGTTQIIAPGEPLHIGMDFNVTKMAAVVFVMREGKPIAVAEHVDVYDTPAMIRLLKAHYGGRSILVYPDSSGSGRRSTNASVSDIALLKGAGFRVCAHPTNPAVKDRIASVNKLLRDGDLRVNVDTCPALTEALEQQAYDKNGEPDKTSGHDHVVDALGYLCAYKFPIERPKAVRAGNWVEGMV